MTFVNLNQNLHIDFSYIKKLNSMFMVGNLSQNDNVCKKICIQQ